MMQRLEELWQGRGVERRRGEEGGLGEEGEVDMVLYEEWDEAAELAGRIPATSVDESPPTMEDLVVHSVMKYDDEYDYDYELCADLFNPTWTPWGSSEVSVSAAELRSVRDELRWAASVAIGVATFWLGGGALLSGEFFSLTSVPSESMAPGVHRGDLMLVDRRRSSAAAVGTGDVVLFAPPPKLMEIAAENGTPLRRGEYFVKRIVAVEGDVVEAREGVLYRNGTREEGYETGTPVGVRIRLPSGTPAPGDGTSTPGTAAAGTISCDACKSGNYSFKPSRVPTGAVLVLGDNRGGSNDGHVWGYLPRRNILGRVTARVAPLDRAGRLRPEPLGDVVRGRGGGGGGGAGDGGGPSWVQ